jgi:archaellum component FlaC
MNYKNHLLIYLYVLVTLTLFTWASLTYAHQDGDYQADRHYYEYYYSGDYHRTHSPYDTADEFLATRSQFYPNMVIGTQPYFDSDEKWKFKYGNDSNSPNQVTVTLQEYHCAPGQDMGNEGSCSAAFHNCVAAQGITVQWDTDQDYSANYTGLNVPEQDEQLDITFDANINSFKGCALTIGNVTDNTTYFTITASFTGGQTVDEDGLPWAHIDGDPYYECLPPLVDSGTGEILHDWGQTGSCDQDNGDNPEPEEPPHSGGADNEGVDDTNPDENPNEDSTETNTGNEGIEDRLDILTDEIEEQGNTLNRIDSELDELDSNTERSANAAEAIAEQFEPGNADSVSDDMFDSETNALDSVESGIGTDTNGLDNHSLFNENPFDQISSLAGASSCSTISTTIFGETWVYPDSSSCNKMHTLRSILEWVVYILLIFYGLSLATRQVN